MRKKDEVVPPTKASTNVFNGPPRAQTSLAKYDAKSELVKESISAYNLRWVDLQAYLRNVFSKSNLEYSNRHEDVSCFLAFEKFRTCFA